MVFMNTIASTTVGSPSFPQQTVGLLHIVRQAVLCSGDTTLDHADVVIDANGSDKKSGFTGTNATHQCRDWESIKTFLVDNRASDMTGILF